MSNKIVCPKCGDGIVEAKELRIAAKWGTYTYRGELGIQKIPPVDLRSALRPLEWYCYHCHHQWGDPWLTQLWQVPGHPNYAQEHWYKEGHGLIDKRDASWEVLARCGPIRNMFQWFNAICKD